MDSPEDNANAMLVYRRSRLYALAQRLAAEFPDAQVSIPPNPDAAVSAGAITLANGYELSFALDADYQDVFYEVVRFRSPGDPAPLPFEQHNFPDSSLTDRLILEQVVALIRQYAALPRRPGA